MNTNSATGINTYPSARQADSVPSGEQVYVLTSSQLNEIVGKIVDDRINAFYESIIKDISADRKRISRLEQAPIEPSKKKTSRLDKLDRLLASRMNQGMTFSEIGKLLEIGSRSENGTNTRKQGMTKFSKSLFSSPDKYIVFQGKTVSGKMVRLTDNYYTDILKRGKSK